jgi:hypothetical protein
MLNQVLLTARLWMGQGPTIALRLLAEPIARLFPQFKDVTRPRSKRLSTGRV